MDEILDLDLFYCHSISAPVHISNEILFPWLTVEWTQNMKRWDEVKKVKILRGGVPQSNGLGEETVTEPRCPTVDAAEPPARVQHGKQSVVRVGGVRGDGLWSGSASAQCPGWRGAGTP